MRRVVAGEAGAWSALQRVIQPTIVAIARKHRDLKRKGLAQLEDDLSEITIATLERLARDDFKNLRRFLAGPTEPEARTAMTFDTWLYGATEFAIREHLRRRFGRAPPQAGERLRVVPSKRDLQTDAGRIDDSAHELRLAFETLQMTTKLAVAEIWKYAETQFSPLEVRALRSYFGEGASFDELASQLELPDAATAERLVRRLTARLRYRFLEQGPTPARGDG